MGKGYLVIELFLADHALPVGGVEVLVKSAQGELIYALTADENGFTDKVELEAPDKANSLSPTADGPRNAVYNVEIPHTTRYKRVFIRGVEVFDGETSILPVQMHPAVAGGMDGDNTDVIIIPPLHGADDPGRRQNAGMSSQTNHTPGGGTGQTAQPAPGPYANNAVPAFDGNAADDPPSFGTPTSPIPANEVAIPYNITVHLGYPNAYARNVRLPFVDYIKNVASSEIFPTWEESALYANIYCQISYALNRIYTLWYRSRGYDYDITNTTAFDQAFVEGRNIFENISRIVDNIFNIFIRRQGRREPFFAAYCNGTTSLCDGLSQWGAQDLALRGYTPIQILRYYFPRDVQTVESVNFAEGIGAYGGVLLREGSTGEDVRTMQVYLNRISGNFYIPAIGSPDGVFRSATTASTMAFQRINNLVADGIIGRITWYAVTKIYVAVRQLAELTSEGERIGIGLEPPTVILRVGSRGEYVVELQFLLNFISEFFPTIPFVVQDGVFRESTKRSVTEFQLEFGLTPDGIVGPITWRKLYDVYNSIQENIIKGMYT